MDELATTRLYLDGNLTIYEAYSGKDRLLNALADCQMLELDLSQVGEMDSAGFQLLVLAKQEAARQGKRLSLVAHSAAVREVLMFLDMVGFFGDPLLIPAEQPA
jgi:anti-sigma B factor antagonist